MVQAVDIDAVPKKKADLSKVLDLDGTANHQTDPAYHMQRPGRSTSSAAASRLPRQPIGCAARPIRSLDPSLPAADFHHRASNEIA
jgi:hypothetical protein